MLYQPMLLKFWTWVIDTIRINLGKIGILTIGKVSTKEQMMHSICYVMVVNPVQLRVMPSKYNVDKALVFKPQQWNIEFLKVE